MTGLQGGKPKNFRSDEKVMLLMPIFNRKEVLFSLIFKFEGLIYFGTTKFENENDLYVGIYKRPRDGPNILKIILVHSR